MCSSDLETRREVDERILEEADSYDRQEKARGYSHGQHHRKLLPAPHRLIPNSEAGVAQTRRARQACHPEESRSDRDDEGSPQFAGNIHWLGVEGNCRDSSSANKNGGLLRMTSLGCAPYHSEVPVVWGPKHPCSFVD